MPRRISPGSAPNSIARTMKPTTPSPPANSPPPPPPIGIGIPGPPKPPPSPPPPRPPPSSRRSSMLLLSSPSICMASLRRREWAKRRAFVHPCRILRGNEPLHCHLEHQLGPATDRQRRTIPAAAQTGRALPAGNQVPGRILPAPRVRGAGLQASPRPGHEILQRGGDPLEGAVRCYHRPPSLRQGGLPPHRGGARSWRRPDPARQPLHPGGGGHPRSRRER